MKELEFQNNVAKVRWNIELGRWELRILNILKAHTDGETKEEHDANKGALVGLATVKGYTVIDEGAK
ncbi:hypothetical protein NYE67_20555 [Solibacillus sp. FSL W8-0474]|uniref:hypothetical protein n=1 Tax=Solibacillus sp. FSL W8-0474 TaxID=2975336 RepID=UPI0030F8939B